MSSWIVQHVHQRIYLQRRPRFWATKKPLRDSDGEESDKIGEDIKIENEESELDCERAQTTKYTTQDFFYSPR